MAENYLQSLLRPFRQRRQRGASMLDSMDSQATMDRLQGSNVTNASMPSQGGGGGILQMASAATGGGGGGDGVIRTASRPTGGRSPFRTAQQTEDDGNASSAQCEPGMKCYRGPSTVVGSEYPRQTTVSQPQIISERVISSRPVVTSSQPTTTYSDPVTSTSLPDAPMTGGIPALVQSAIGNAGSVYTAPVAGAQMIGAKTLMLNDQIQSDNAYRDQMLPFKQTAAMAATDAMNAEAEAMRATAFSTNEEGRLTGAQADMTAAETMPGLTRQHAGLMDEVITGRISTASAVDAVMQQRGRSAVSSVDAEGKKTFGSQAAPPSGVADADQRKALFRQFGAAQGVGFMFMHSAVLDSENGDSPVDHEKVIGDMSERFIDTLDQSGDMNKSKAELRGILRDDVQRTMIGVNVRRFTFGIDEKKNPDGYREAVVAGTADAMKYYNALEGRAMVAWNERHSGAVAPKPIPGSNPTNDAKAQLMLQRGNQ